MPSRDDLSRLRDEAGAEVTTLEQDLRALFEASVSSNADDEHDPEGATIAFERAQLTAVLAAARRRVTELTDAVARLDAGRYGVCDSCGEPIPAARLTARPAASTCVSCAS
jgi:RNA polymerase-binding transcription factor DksA